MIDRSHQLPLIRQSSLLKLSRSSLYYEAVPVSVRDLEMMRLIDELHMKYPFWGSRSLRDELRGRGYSNVGRGHVSGTGLGDRRGIQFAVAVKFLGVSYIQPFS